MFNLTVQTRMGNQYASINSGQATYNINLAMTFATAEEAEAYKAANPDLGAHEVKPHVV